MKLTNLSSSIVIFFVCAIKLIEIAEIISNKIRIFFFVIFSKLLLVTSRGLALVGDLVSQRYKLKTELPSTKPTQNITI